MDLRRRFVGVMELCGEVGVIGGKPAKTLLWFRRWHQTTTRDNMPPKQLKRKNDDGPCGRSGEVVIARAKTTGEDDGIELILDVIGEEVVRFLGVRSLISFGATSKAHRIVMEKEIERRKAYIAQVEVEVTQLMAAMYQPKNLSAYIKKKFDVFYSAGNQEPEDTDDYEDCGLTEEDYDEVKELYARVEKESGGGVRVSNPTRGDFIAAKKLVYNAMRLIDDEIGIFYTASAAMEDAKYFDVWEDDESYDDAFSEEDQVLPFGVDEPGDKIDIFSVERQKFFSIVKSRGRKGLPGSLFILPSCFFFPSHGELSTMSIECIRKAIKDINTGVGHAYFLRSEMMFSSPEEFDSVLDNVVAKKIAADGNIDAFRVAAREMFFNHSKDMKPYLKKTIMLANEHQLAQQKKKTSKKKKGGKK